MTVAEDYQPDTFVYEIARRCGLGEDNLLVQYLERKTRAASRGSKARRSLGNLYALLVLAEDFVDGRPDGSRFTDLLARMRQLPFGSKLQNHPLDNRLNDEFSRQYEVQGELLPVQPTVLEGQKARRISLDLLAHNNADPNRVAQFVIETIRAYIGLITEKQTAYLDEIEAIETDEDLKEFMENAFDTQSDARLFEIVSYVLLSEYFRLQAVWIGENRNEVKLHSLNLYRTGRTNANDGGIDFVLQPLGRFFQVTETLDFEKYFLDFEKVNRYPFSFVIKTDMEKSIVLRLIYKKAKQSGRYSDELLDIYMPLFEEIFTLPDIRRIVEGLHADADTLARMKTELRLQFQLEYGLLD